MTEIITKAAFQEGVGRVVLRDVALPDITLPESRPGLVLLGDIRGSVCGTDKHNFLHIGEEKALGHEFGGVVQAVGRDVTEVEVGQIVAAWPPLGWPFAGVAAHTIVPARYCVPMSSREHVWAVEPLGCTVVAVVRTVPFTGPLAFSGHPLEGDGHRPKRRRHIVVYGTGTMAFCAIALAQLEDPLSVTVVGRSQASLDRAVALGATAVINTSGVPIADVVAEVVRSTDGRGADVVFEAIGEPHTLAAAHDMAGMNGQVSPLGFHQTEDGIRELKVAHHLNWRSISVPSGHVRDAETAGQEPEEDLLLPARRLAARLIDDGVIDPSLMVEGVWPLSDLKGAVKRSTEPGVGKVVIDSTLG